MTEFSTSGLLNIEVSQASLRSARSTIQSELGDVEVDVNASASNQLNPQNQRPAGTDQAISQQLLSDHSERIGTVSDQLTENLDLNETRNNLLRTLIDETERAGRRAARGGGMGGGGALGLFALGGAGLGTALLGDINIPTPDWLPLEFQRPDWLPPEVPQPDWTPLPVERPEPLTIPDIPPLDVPEIPPLEVPEISPLEVPDIPPLEVPEIAPLEIPEIPPLDIPEIDPIPVAAPDVIPVAAPDSIPVTLPSPNIGADEAIAGGTAVAGGAGAAWLARQGSRIGPAAGGAASGVATPGIAAEMIPDEIGSELAPGDELAPSILQPEGRATRLGGVGEWLNKQLGTPADEERVARIRGTTDASGGGGRSNSGQTITADGLVSKLDQVISNLDGSGGNDITVDHTSTFEIGDLRELKQSQQDDIRELERQIDDIKRQITRGRR